MAQFGAFDEYVPFPSRRSHTLGRLSSVGTLLMTIGLATYHRITEDRSNYHLRWQI